MNTPIVPNRASSLLALTLWLVTSAALQGAVRRVPAEHPTLQAAINAASSGDEIRLAAGVYRQSARVLGKQLLITGEEGAVLQAWLGLNANAPSGLLEAGLGSHLTVRGLKFDGARVAEANPQNNLLGMFFYAGSGVVENCTFEGFRGTTKLGSLSASAAGTFAGAPSTYQGPPIHVVIRNNRYRDNGISVWIGSGSANPDSPVLRTSFAILDNTIEGNGAASIDFQDGIRLIPGSSGLVKGNRVTDHFRTDPNLQTSLACRMTWERIQTPQQPVRFEANSFLRNQQAFELSEADHAEFVNNVVEGRGTEGNDRGGIIMTGKSVVLSGNQFSHLPRGVYLAGNTGSGSVDTVLAGNRFCDVATVLQTDEQVSGTLDVGQLGCEPDAPTSTPIHFAPAAAAAGETVTISGPELDQVRRVLFHGTQAEFAAQTDALGVTTLKAVVPLRARDGAITVVRDTTAATSANLFTRQHTLSVIRAAGEPLTLSWTAGAEDFSLEASGDPAQGWQAVIASPFRVDNRYRLLPETGQRAKFFRLHRN